MKHEFYYLSLAHDNPAINSHSNAPKNLPAGMNLKSPSSNVFTFSR